MLLYVCDACVKDLVFHRNLNEWLSSNCFPFYSIYCSLHVFWPTKSCFVHYSPRHSVGGSGGGGTSRTTSNDAKVEPSDRVLAMRKMVGKGWSQRTAQNNQVGFCWFWSADGCWRDYSGANPNTTTLPLLFQWRQPDPISDDETAMILRVMEKAEALEKAEQQRVG